MKVLVTGGNGFLGSKIMKVLKDQGYDGITFGSRNFDLCNPRQTKDAFDRYRPDAVIHCAAVVGGIGANRVNPGSFFYQNMMMGLNVIENCRFFDVQKVVQIGTVCSYPKYTPVPFSEDSLWDGYPEETNAPYGIAKKALYVMIEAYKNQYDLNGCVLLPCNLYGPNDNFDPGSSHVIPALIKRFIDAKQNNDTEVECWGSGSATREFLYVDDAAEAIVKSLSVDTDTKPINLGSGVEITIKDLAEKIKTLVGYDGNIAWNSDQPDGQPRRFLDVSRAKKILDWEPKVSFDAGLKETIEWYGANKK
jgi:nucleoside-diphosphate-sugar epimerase